MSDWVPECVTHGTILEFFFELLHNDYLPNGFNWKFHFTFVISLLTKCVYSSRVKWDDEWQKWPKSTRSNLTLAVSCDSRWQWLISIYPIRKISLNDSKFLHLEGDHDLWYHKFIYSLVYIFSPNSFRSGIVLIRSCIKYLRNFYKSSWRFLRSKIWRNL